MTVLTGLLIPLALWAYVNSRNDNSRDLWVLLVFGAILASAFLWYLRKTLDRRPVLTLAAEGISCREQVEKGEAPIPWSDVHSIGFRNHSYKWLDSDTEIDIERLSIGPMGISLGHLSRQDRNHRLRRALRQCYDAWGPFKT